MEGWRCRKDIDICVYSVEEFASSITTAGKCALQMSEGVLCNFPWMFRPVNIAKLAVLRHFLGDIIYQSRRTLDPYEGVSIAKKA